MTVLHKGADPSGILGSRELSWDSNAGDFSSGDVIDISKCFSGPATVEINVSGGASCTVRKNSMNRRYPPDEEKWKLGMYVPDFSKEEVWYNESSPTYSLTSGETITMYGVTSLQFTALSGTVVVTARG